MKLNVNGADVEVDDRHAKDPLLWVVRDVLGMTGTKFGCGAGFCAACTVLIDGRSTKACQTATERAVGKSITTVEGASGRVANAVRSAWHRGNVIQCGYCQPGQTLAAMALLEFDPAPDDATIDTAMNGNLCRCGTYPRIRAAIKEAAATLAAGDDPGELVAPPEPDGGRLTAEEMLDPVHPYVRIRPDGTIVVYSSQLEMGQGIHTGLATLVAEELDADFGAVRVLNAANGWGPTGDVYGNPELGGAFQITGASNSTQGSWMRYRVAAAQARARLVAAAAQAWAVEAVEIEIDAGVISHPDGQRATFGELTALAEQQPVPDDVQVKDLAKAKLIGREDILRVDAPAKILGRTVFAIDVQIPGMLTAVVLHASRFGATVASIDEEETLQEAGVVAVVPVTDGVAVVGTTMQDAIRGLRRLHVEWDDRAAERRSSEQLLDAHRHLVESGESVGVSRDDGDVEQALQNAEHVIEAFYELPYLAHAPMEPNNAVCRMREDGILEVWAGTESPEYTRMNAAEAGGLDKEQIEVHVPLAGGSFGLHTSVRNDPTSEAVEIARALEWKHPVKVQSLREEEFKSGRFRAMAVHRVRAGADASGRLTVMDHRMAAQPTSPNLPFVRDVMFKNGIDFFTVTGAADPPYAFGNFRLESSNFESTIPTMVWRSVGNSHTEFARESAIDELAVATGRDPVDLRRELLADNPRTLRALELAAERAGWGTPPPEGVARGIACSSFLSHSAHVVEVSLDERGRVHIERVVAALDCGITITPDLVRAQVEGSVLFGLGAAAWGEIVLAEGGELLTQNFDRYRVMRMQSTPRCEIHLIASSEKPSGVGEVSTPTAAPALANAIAALTGTRIRRLPLSKSIPIY
ncbi:MAG: isoquinoline 1-oxidoreductase beta subunit [Conexibacter sp.]|nr:isoquinoline 1-oxidoreductase beta subunit [Conexibacter sp.]